MYMDEKRYAVMLTETQEVKVLTCNPARELSGTEPFRRLPKPLPVVLLIRRNELRPLRPGDSLAGKAIWRDNHGGKGKTAGSAQLQNN